MPWECYTLPGTLARSQTCSGLWGWSIQMQAECCPLALMYVASSAALVHREWSQMAPSVRGDRPLCLVFYWTGQIILLVYEHQEWLHQASDMTGFSPLQRPWTSDHHLVLQFNGSGKMILGQKETKKELKPLRIKQGMSIFTQLRTF